jgi:hypothetical protein
MQAQQRHMHIALGADVRAAAVKEVADDIRDRL